MCAKRLTFRPAYIKQSGTAGNGEGATRPVYVVVLETLWHENTDVRSLSPQLVHEIAKHECSIRFYPPGHEREGDIWICDRIWQDMTDADGDRCECGSTYWKLQDGDPHCATCGRPRHDDGTHQPAITAEMFADSGDP